MRSAIWARDAGCVALLVTAACGPGQAPADPTAEATPPEPTDTSAPDGAEPTADSEVLSGEGPAEATAPAGPAETEQEELARYLIKLPGRRVAYSAQKKGFAVTRETVSGGTFTVDVVFTDEQGRSTEVVRICDPSECDEALDDLAKKKIPELAQRFSDQGYVSIRAVGWPSGRGELDVGSMGLKLILKDRRLTAEREGKPPKPIGTLPAKSPALLAIFPVPDAELIGVYAAPDESGANKEFVAFKTK